MTKRDILDWVRQEFTPVELVTPDSTILQIIDNAVRYLNSYSAFKVTSMVAASPSTTRVQLGADIKTVVKVIPGQPPVSILMNYPTWSLLGIAVLDNVTSDLMLMTESFKNYKYYIGSDFRWNFEPSTDPSVGGYLYFSNVPEGSTALCVVGTKRILKDENDDYSVTDEFSLNWLLPYVKALVKQAEGNTLRKTDVIGIKNDGDSLYKEGIDEQKELKTQLNESGRWVALVKRF